MLVLDQVSRSFGPREVLSGVTLRVDRRQVVALLGCNGAGKTTLLRLAAGLLPPTEGRVEVGGVDVTREGPRIRQRIGYLPEAAPLYGEMRVKEFLRFRAGIKGLGSTRARRRVREVVELCGLGDVRRTSIRRLSIGFRQRVALAEVLLGEPELLLLDEPTRGLDAVQAESTWSLLRQVGQDQAVLLATHDLAAAARFGTHLAVLRDARLAVYDATPRVLDPLPHGSQIQVELRGPEAAIREGLSSLALVQRIELGRSGGWTVAKLEGVATADLRLPVAQLARDQGWDIRELHLERRELGRLLTAPAEPPA